MATPQAPMTAPTPTPVSSYHGEAARVDKTLDFNQREGDKSQDVFRSQMDSAWMNLEGPIDPSKIDVMGVIKQLN